jgi:rSAM/selenodomain-associated transferase 2
MAEIRLSIVIPALNEAAGIGLAVEHGLRLTPVDLVVVDGGSSDATAETARRAGATVIATRAGRGHQQAAGASATLGDVLLFLHADTWLAPEARGQIEAALDDAATIGGAFRQEIDAAGFVYRWLEAGNAARVRWFKLAYGDQGIFVRRSAYESVGGFADLPLMEDVALMTQLRRRGRIALLPGPLRVSARRWRKHGVTRQTVRNWVLLAAYRLGVSPHRLARAYEG